MNLYIKLHNSCLAVVMDDRRYEVLAVHTDLIKTSRGFREHFKLLANLHEIKNIYIEKAFLRLLGENQKQIATAIIHIQRHFGMLVCMIDELFPEAHMDQISGRVARKGVYGDKILTKDVQISEASAILSGAKERNYSALHMLALHDCLVLRTYFNNKENN